MAGAAPYQWNVSKGLEIAFLKAKAAEKNGEHAEAAGIYAGILQAFPGNTRARKALAAIGTPATVPAETLTQAEVDGFVALFNEGRPSAVVARGEAMATDHPASFILSDIIATAHIALGQMEQATHWLGRALVLRPDNVQCHYNLGVALQELGRPDAALTSYRRVLALNADHAEAHTNAGTALLELGRAAEAIAHCETALRLAPQEAKTHHNLSVALTRSGRLDEAITHSEAARRLDPGLFGAELNLAIALRETGRLDEAIAAYARALAIQPEHAAARSQMLHQQAVICDWSALAAEAASIPALGLSGRAVLPFGLLSLDDDPGRQRRRAERYAAEEFGTIRRHDFAVPAAPSGPLRIGYFSADFQSHATLHLAARMFELHDRDRFIIHAFSYGPEGEDAMRRRLRGAVHAFHDVGSMEDGAVAALARDQDIDIAVDLKGYTRDARLGILAHGAAPVQISYLGFPGTLAAPFIDYIVADPVVVPPEQRHHYAESIIYLPGSYQVNDNSRPISERAMTRAAYGLPENGFVFCCFNNNYKISPDAFDIWMRLLLGVEGSVLWLLKTNRWAEENLRAAAAARGVAADRLVFAGRVPPAEHLARHKLADLFLDTFSYNAHTTGSDALWAGLPLVTRAGESFAARVGASLLKAVGLPELIATTPEGYEKLALDLAQSPDGLAAVRRKLAADRLTAPLFDTARFTRDIEQGYSRAYATFIAGGSPADIMIGSA